MDFIDENTLEEDNLTVKTRSLSGVFFLISRSIVIQLISFGATVLLTIFLDPKNFGIYYLVTAFINFFVYFSDIGLAAALIQKKEKLTREDLKTTFTIQQILVIILITILIVISHSVIKWYKLDNQSLFLFYSLAFSFFLSSLKTIPSVILERGLKFNLLIFPQILETIVFNVIVVFLAWKGMGVNSFSWAVLARGVVGMAAMYIVCPWKIGFAISKDSLKKLLKFGLPYQFNTLIAVAKDDLMTIFLGKMIGPSGLGYLGWAKKWAEIPLRFLMDNVTKVAFPAFSRIQDDKEKLKAGLEKALFYLSFLTFPILVGFSVLASDMVKIIPRYLKWQPALIPLYLYCFNSMWATISTPLTNFLNATGKIKKTFYLMLMWLILTWIFMPVLGHFYGFVGIAYASALIAFSSIAVILIVRKTIKFDLFRSILKPLFASLGMGLFLFIFKPSISTIPFQIIIRIFSAVIVYFSLSYLFLGSSLYSDIRKILYEIKNKN